MGRVVNKDLAGVPADAGSSTSVVARNGGIPFAIGPDGDRAAVIAKYERWLADQRHLLRSLDELRGCDLVLSSARRSHAMAIS